MSFHTILWSGEKNIAGSTGLQFGGRSSQSNEYLYDTKKLLSFADPSSYKYVTQQYF